jgi:hypothetical protein
MICKSLFQNISVSWGCIFENYSFLERTYLIDSQMFLRGARVLSVCHSACEIYVFAIVWVIIVNTLSPLERWKNQRM